MAELDKETVAALTRQLKQSDEDRDKFRSSLADIDKRLSRMEKGDKSSSSSSSTYSSRGGATYGSTLSRMNADMSGIFRDSLTDFIEVGVKLYGGLIDYGASELENRAAVTFKLQGEKITEMALDTQKFIGSKSILGVFGSAEAARKELAEIYDANSYYLNRIGEDYKNSDDAGMQVMANSLIVKRALRINQQDFAKIIENQMASSKKVTEEVFQEIAFYAGEYSNRTSASIFQITNQLTRAISDFDTFGGASVESLGKLAGFMGELKMDTESVAGLIKRMQSFQGSVGIVKELAGAFGAVIDPAKLMGDAIRDPAEALNTIRQSLFDAGHNSETLGFKITLLADSMNVSSEAMRRFLNEEIDAQQVLENSVKQTEYSAESANKVISQTQKQIVDSRTIMDTVKDVAEAKSEAIFQGTYKTINQFRSDFNQFITDSGEDIVDALGTDGIKEFAEASNKYLLGANEKIREEGQKELDALLDPSNFSVSAAAKINEFREQIAKINEEGNLGAFNEYLEKEKTLQYKVDFDEKQVEETYEYLNKSDEVKKFHETFNSHFDYVRQNSDSKFMTDTKAGFSTYRNELTSTQNAMTNFHKHAESLGDIEVNFKIKSGEKELTTDEFKEEIKVVTEMQKEADPNQRLYEKIDELLAAITNNKIDNINVNNQIVAEVTLGKSIRDEFKTISKNSTVEVLKNLKIL